jgi:hypothetical protein
MDTTLTVICAALLIWFGLGRPASSTDDRSRSATRRVRHQLVHLESLSAARVDREQDLGSIISAAN